MRKIMCLWAVMFGLLLLAGCGHSGERLAEDGGSWQGLRQCSPHLSVVGNRASCGLFVQGAGFDVEIGANLRLQRLENGAYKTIRLWYGLSGNGELDFADRCWLNQPGSYRLSAQVWVGDLAPVVLQTDLKLAETPPQRPNGEELAYEMLALFAFDMPEEELLPTIWEEILTTARTEADRYYNAAPGLLLVYNKEDIMLPLGVVERLAAALERGELRQVALALPQGRVCFLAGSESLAGLARQIEEAASEEVAGLRLRLTAEGGGFSFDMTEASSGQELTLADRVLVYGALTGEAAEAWQQSARRRPSEPMEQPLYADMAVFYNDKPVAAADFVYGLADDVDSGAYARILTKSCGWYQAKAVAAYDGSGRWYDDYVNYLAARGVIVPGGFAPEQPINRAELALLLYKLAGEPDEPEEPDLAYILTSTPYNNALRWAYDCGILTGLEDGRLLLEEGLTRQELLVMLYRYVGLANTTLPHHREDIRYFDRGRIGGFAREAVSAFSEAGLAPREDWRRLGPNKRVTQAEAAKLAALVNQSILSGLEQFVLK